MNTSLEDRLAAYREPLDEAIRHDEERRVAATPSRRRTHRRSVAAVAVLILLGGASGVAWVATNRGAAPSVSPSPLPGPQTTTPTGEPVSTEPTTTDVDRPTSVEPPAALVVGSSLVVGAAEELAREGLVVDATVDRTPIDMIGHVADLLAADPTVDTVVMHVGFNGTITADRFDAFIDEAADSSNIVLITLRIDREYAELNNSLLRAAAARHERISLMDWQQLAERCPGDCFEPDDIHLTHTGQRYFASLVRQHLDDLGGPPSAATTAGTETGPTTSTPSSSASPARLLLDRPPGDGFILAGAEMQGDVSGVATYRSPDHDTELQIIVRNRDQLPPPTAIIDQRLIATIEGRMVWSDGEGDGSCLPDVCSIGILWDESTWVSLVWVDQSGGQLVDGSTEMSLLDLVLGLRPQPERWVQVAELSAPENDPPVGFLIDVAPGRVVVANANTVGGSAGAISGQFVAAGFEVDAPVNSERLAQSTTIVQTTQQAQCLAIQVALALSTDRVELIDSDFAIAPGQQHAADVAVILGDDIARLLGEDYRLALVAENDLPSALGQARCET